MRLSSFIIFACLALPAVHANAQARLDKAERADIKTHLQNITPEQRDALTAKDNAKWQNLTPAQRKATEAKARAKFDRLTPAQEHALEERFKGRHN